MPITKYDEQVIAFVIDHIEYVEPTACDVKKGYRRARKQRR